MRERIHKIVQIADPGDKLSSYYDKFMLMSIIVSLIPLFFKHASSFFRWIEIITVSVFIVDYLFRWITADYKLNDKSKTVFIKYPFTFLQS